MGAHAFDDEPEHCRAYRLALSRALPDAFGIAERWNMPGARHRRALGAGAEFAAVPHYVLTYHLGGGEAQRLDGRTPWPVARTGAVSLQAPGSAGRFASTGVVSYAHLYFRQGLLCEIADEAGLSVHAEPDDFFGAQDAAWSHDLEGYLRRALDTDDPPTALEMDGRAYVVGFGLLRALGRRRTGVPALDPVVKRPDMHRVLEMIEDRLTEPLRLSDLAAALDMSPFHFSRVFKASVGETPARYVKRRRVERAVALLACRELSLSEVAFRTGFSSQSQMTHALKAATGATPGALRARAGE